MFIVQATLGEIRQLLVDLGVSEYGGANCISRLGQIVGKIKNLHVYIYVHDFYTGRLIPGSKGAVGVHKACKRRCLKNQCPAHAGLRSALRNMRGLRS